MDAYRPRNRSSTLANRKTPPPANCSSSNSISTRRPRAKVRPCSRHDARVMPARSTPPIPSICCSPDRGLGEVVAAAAVSRSASRPPSDQRQVVERQLRDQPPELWLAERRLDDVGRLDERDDPPDRARRLELEVAGLVAERQPARQIAVEAGEARR